MQGSGEIFTVDWHVHRERTGTGLGGERGNWQQFTVVYRHSLERLNATTTAVTVGD